jgi:predicted phage terminase large subunit-like protein
MEPLYHVNVPGFTAVTFRKTYPQLMEQGGLWDTTQLLYPQACGQSQMTRLTWTFPSGANVRLAHMQNDQDRHKWQGAQIALISFDQLEHFSFKQWSYMLSRNRSVCGIRPYMRATCNPDPDHWLRTFIDWWIGPDGYPIPERAGVVRWFVMDRDSIVWADRPSDFLGIPDANPMSFTFIPSRVEDNPTLLGKDPGYLAKLDALGSVDRGRLRFGNWNVRDRAGSFFRREWFKIVDAAPPCDMEVRYWDRAATPNNPTGSWTAGVRMGRCRVRSSYQYYVKHVARFQGTPLTVEQGVVNTASQDGRDVLARVERDPGQAGVAEAGVHVRNLAGYDVKAINAREAKGRRARGFSAQAEAGNVFMVRGDWNDPYLNELVNFDGSSTCQSDQVDGSSGAFNELTNVVYAGTWGS